MVVVFVLWLAILVLVPRPADAISVSFDNITNNNPVDAATAGQYLVDVTGTDGSQVRFEFTNAGPAASSITDVYFDGGTLLGIASIVSGAGVSYAANAQPRNLPGGKAFTPPFRTTRGLSADSDAPVQRLGVNPGEWVAIVFDLRRGNTRTDTLAALADGSLRIGIRVQGFESGGSESFVNAPPVPVPEPVTIVLLGTGLAGMGLWARRRAAMRRSTSPSF
jgi:hypothetical protein